MKRYEIDSGYYNYDVEESPDGKWVKWDDAEKLEALNAELLYTLEMLQVYCKHLHGGAPMRRYIRAAIAKSDLDIDNL